MQNPCDVELVSRPRTGTSTAVLAGAAMLGLLLAAGLALWAVYGDGLYAERLLSMIASCI
jgi:hypothetical protein